MSISVDRPAFCGACGNAHPWTSWALHAAKELARMELAEKDLQDFADVVEGLVKDSAMTPVYAAKFRRLVTSPVLVEGLKTILFEVIAEGAKKQIWP